MMAVFEPAATTRRCLMSIDKIVPIAGYVKPGFEPVQEAFYWSVGCPNPFIKIGTKRYASEKN
jgi:hypothetical protein